MYKNINFTYLFGTVVGGIGMQQTTIFFSLKQPKESIILQVQYFQKPDHLYKENYNPFF